MQLHWLSACKLHFLFPSIPRWNIQTSPLIISKYWDWPLYASAPEDSPLFNGSDTSIGGNGDYIVHDGPVITPPDGVGGGDIQLPAGTGGSYVTTGAFANMTVNLGPVGGLLGVAAGPDGGLGYNPRRLKRDLGGAMNTRYANYTTVLSEFVIERLERRHLDY